MLFNSIDFLIFFPIVLTVYYILPRKVRYIWLLAASYYFYMQWNPIYIFLILGCTVITYFSGLLIEHFKKQNDTSKKAQKWVMIGCTVLLLGVLILFKYYNWGVSIINGFLQGMQAPGFLQAIDLILPVGISFYVLQSMGYVFDVYRGEVYAEKNFLRYALFISFFPQLVAGPIERTKNLLCQLRAPEDFSFDSFIRGLYLIFWGLFTKLVIADRAAIFVDAVYSDPDAYHGLYIVFATFLFALQIYCDFYGYSTIARGAARMLGIKLTDNFCAPYFSVTVKDFWRRWHISLSSWFRDYLYIPLGGNRKGKKRQYLNLIITFGVSGLWHGASISYITWGVLNALYQVVADIFHLPQSGGNAFVRTLKRIGTFILICITWVFFRAGDFSNSLLAFKNMFRDFSFKIISDGSIFQLGVSTEYMIVLLCSILLLFIVDYFKYSERDLIGILIKSPMFFRVITLTALLLVNLVFGCYGEMYDTQAFIYFQF